MINEKIMKLFEEYCEKHKIEGKEKEQVLKKVEAYANNYIYEPGEAIGIIAAQSISEPATQMSIDAKEKIVIKHRNAISIQEIGAFTDSTIGRLGAIRNDGWEVSDLSSMEIYVPSINAEEKIEWKRVLACSRHASPAKLIKLRTLSGRKITATDSHSFVVRKNNKIVAVSGKTLKKGDRIPSIKVLPERCIDSLNIKSISQNEFSRARKPLPENLPLNEITGWIFGAYLSEGNCTPNFVCISNTDESFLQKTRLFAAAYNLGFNEYDNRRGFARGHDMHINSALLSSLLKKTCGKGSENKKVPDFAYSANENFVSALLQAYFDGDGNISVERGVIRASSNSQELIDGIALLLARFGIFSYKGMTNRSAKGASVCRQFTLTIPAKHAAVFREKIGFATAKKSQRLDALCRIKTTQDFIEVVSGFDDLLVKTARKLGYPTRCVNSFTKRQKIGKEALLKYITIFSSLAKEKGVDIGEELKIMKTMHASDVVWDEIDAVEYVEPASKFVYDLTVEGTETFTTFDGIVTHNTMRSYTLASQSDRLSKVTQGLPRLIEIFDARKTFEKNMMIYLKKEFNDKEKAREVALRIKAQKISDIIKSDSVNLIELRIELELEREKDKEDVKKVIAKYVKGCDVSFRENRVFVKPSKDDAKNLRKMRNKILKLHITGIKGIEDVIVVKEDEDWMLQTVGTNMKKLLQVKEIDVKRTKSNDVYQVYEILGIEAARNIILHEAKDTLDEQGLDIDARHLMLLADTMTFDGEVKAVGRYGVSGKKSSVLAKANFEETKKHLINASFYGETDNLDGVIENILVGQIAPIGTGMVELTIDMNKMRETLKKK